jgi:prepilin-type N-terminal cleavage/methylation domain-containing protein
MRATGRQAGFSLVELMIAAALSVIVMMSVTQAFISQQNTHVVVDQVAEAQQNLRAVSDLIERDVRRAGYMVPPHAAVCGYDDTTGPDTLFVSKTDAIRTVFDLEDEDLSLTGDKGAPVAGATSTFNATGSGFTLTLAQKWVDYQPDGDDFAVDEGVIVVSERNEDAPVACGKITAISGNALTVDFGSTSTGAVGMNANVLAIPAHVYQLELGASGAPNRLRRNDRLLASDVEDFQVAYFFDEDDDLVVDVGEIFGDAGTTAQPWELTPIANRPDFSAIREVVLNIVTVTRSDDPNIDYQIGAGQVRGNRTAGSLPSGDGKRRRVSSARVRLRNVR